MEAGKVILEMATRRRSTWSMPWWPPPTTASATPMCRHRALRLPHLRLLLRHVHRQLHELPAEAMGLALPGNGSTLATHADREACSARPAAPSSIWPSSYYEAGRRNVLPRGIATFAAFENAMTLDIAMGGSTNTVLHLLAIAHEGEVDFTMDDIDRLSRKVPVLCKVAPAVENDPHGRRPPRRRHLRHPR
jgi:hypothetical protein